MYENHNKIPCACLRNTKMKTCMTQMCSLRHQRLNTAEGFFFPRRLTQFTKTTKRKNVTWMEIVAWIVKKQSYVCVFAYWPPKSRTRQLRAFVTLNNAGEKEKARAALATLLMHVHVSRRINVRHTRLQHMAHSLLRFWALVGKLATAFSRWWCTKFATAVDLRRVRLERRRRSPRRKCQRMCVVQFVEAKEGL